MNEIDLTNEIAAFLRERAQLQSTHALSWVVFSDQTFQGAFDEYEPAVRFAVSNFSNRSFLVRKVDAEDERVPLIFTEAG